MVSRHLLAIMYVSAIFVAACGSGDQYEENGTETHRQIVADQIDYPVDPFNNPRTVQQHFPMGMFLKSRPSPPPDFNAQMDCINPKEEGQATCGTLPNPETVRSCLACYRAAQDACLATGGTTNKFAGCSTDQPTPAHSPNAPPEVACYGAAQACKLECANTIQTHDPYTDEHKAKLIQECQAACFHIDAIEGCVNDGVYFAQASEDICINESAIVAWRFADVMCERAFPDNSRVCKETNLNLKVVRIAECYAAFGPL